MNRSQSQVSIKYYSNISQFLLEYIPEFESDERIQPHRPKEFIDGHISSFKISHK